MSLSNGFRLDFTLSEIAMSRCLWHEGDASTNFRIHQDTSEYTLLVDDGSVYCNSFVYPPSMTTNQQCTLKESIPVNSIEENQKKENTAISPFNVPCEPSTDRVEDEQFVPKKEIVKFPHEGKVYCNNN